MRLVIVTSDPMTGSLIDEVRKIAGNVPIICTGIEEAISYIRSHERDYQRRVEAVLLDVHGLDDSSKRRLKRVARENGIDDAHIKLIELLGNTQQVLAWLRELDERSRR